MHASGIEDTRRQLRALGTLEAALVELLAAYGEMMTERSTVTINRRPGVLVLEEADDDAGRLVRLMVNVDRRTPAAFGRRLE